MKNTGHCHACRREVADNPRVCPLCGAPNPTLGYSVTKPIATAVAMIVLLSIIADIVHSRRPQYVSGQTYAIAKNGFVCLTLKGLAKANERGGVTPDEAEQLGCLPLALEQHPQVRVLERDEAAIKVLVLAPDLKVDNFQGWTAADNLDPAPVAAQ